MVSKKLKKTTNKQKKAKKKQPKLLKQFFCTLPNRMTTKYQQKAKNVTYYIIICTLFTYNGQAV